MSDKCDCLAKKVLAELVAKLNVYNGDDMLDGCLDSLATMEIGGKPINLVLPELGVDGLSIRHKGFHVSASLSRHEIYVFNMGDTLVFTIQDEDVPGDVDMVDLVTYDEDELKAWVLEHYGDMLCDLGLILP